MIKVCNLRSDLNKYFVLISAKLEIWVCGWGQDSILYYSINMTELVDCHFRTQNHRENDKLPFAVKGQLQARIADLIPWVKILHSDSTVWIIWAELSYRELNCFKAVCVLNPEIKCHIQKNLSTQPLQFRSDCIWISCHSFNVCISLLGWSH